MTSENSQQVKWEIEILKYSLILTNIVKNNVIYIEDVNNFYIFIKLNDIIYINEILYTKKFTSIYEFLSSFAVSQDYDILKKIFLKIEETQLKEL